MVKNMMPFAPKSSILRNSEVRGQFTTPQKKQTIPRAAANPGSIPMRPPATQPNVAPTKNDGTISPPLKPQPIVMAVNSAFRRKAAGWASPFNALAMIFIPVPL